MIRRILSAWTVVVPIVALVALVATWGRTLPTAVVVIVGILLIGAVLAAVHHAEVVAHRVGEPFGSLVLAVVGDGHRGRADHHAVTLRRSAGRDARARHGVLGGDDHDERDRRASRS